MQIGYDEFHVVDITRMRCHCGRFAALCDVLTHPARPVLPSLLSVNVMSYKLL